MRPLSGAMVLNEGELLLLTAEEVEPGVPVQVADFKDTQALFYSPLGAWIGMSSAGMQLGTGLPEMRDGIWYVRRDEGLLASAQNIEPKAGDIVFRRLP